MSFTLKRTSEHDSGVVPDDDTNTTKHNARVMAGKVREQAILELRCVPLCYGGPFIV